MSTPRSIAVTGLHRGTNPQPGPGVIRSLRRVLPGLRVVGLVYDAYESGVFVEDGPDACAAMPFPTAGAGAWLERLDEVRAEHPFDLLLPTLDAEIAILAGAAGDLARRGLRVMLPDPATLARRDKTRLPELCEACGVATPETRVARDLGEALRLADAYPLVIKGSFYGARPVRDQRELAAEGAKILAEWGPPLVLQEAVAGQEFCVMGIGDRKGGIVGSCSVRKTVLSDQGKGMGAVTVRDPRLDEAAARLVSELRWPGPFELEFIHDPGDPGYQLIEINPRFPAWVDFASQVGANFPAALHALLAGGDPPPLPAVPAGRFFLRHQVEVVGSIDQVAGLLRQSQDESFQANPNPLAS